MILEIFSSGPADTNSILLCSKTSPQALIFDAPFGSVEHWSTRLKELEKTVGFLFLTHSHWDHIADAALAKKTWKMPIGIHKDDVKNLEKPGSDRLPLLFPIEGEKADFYVVDREEKKVCDLKMIVFHTPGHSPGGVCYYFPELKLLISGDTLFQGSIGNLSFPSAQPELMKGSLEKILRLPSETLVIPGHGETTTIGDEQGIIGRFFYD